jgi:energy-dependent translational throttle protein EttA
MAKYQYIYFMQGLTKAYTGGKKVLENIYLQFYPDAKIGIVGVNGAGKSTLLRIMAGIDKEFSGEAYPADGARVGFLPQEPQLDASKTVFENVMEGLGPIKEKIDAFNAVSAEMAEAYSDELMEKMSKLQEEIDAADGWDIDSRIDMAMEALRCPPGDWKVDKRREAPRRARPAAALEAGPPSP